MYYGLRAAASISCLVYLAQFFGFSPLQWPGYFFTLHSMSFASPESCRRVRPWVIRPWVTLTTQGRAKLVREIHLTFISIYRPSLARDDSSRTTAARTSYTPGLWPGSNSCFA